MTLLFPLGLLALLALPIIALLHLLRERRKRVVVPSLLLWQNVPRRPDGQRSSVLPVTLLLLLHLLAALALAVALAQPRWLGRLLGGNEQLVVVVDTTTSMGARLGSGTRLQAAQAQAASLIRSLGGGDTAALIALGPQARLVARGAAEDAPSLLASLEGLHAGGTGADVAGALTLAQAALQEDRPGRVVVLSDGALPESQQIPQPLAATLDWRPVGDRQDNLGIVTFAAQPRGSGAGAAVQAYARVANYGPSSTQTWVRLFGDDRQLDERFIDLAPDDESELTWSLPAGIATLRAELGSDDALAADNTASLSLAQVRPLSVLLVSEPPATAAGASRQAAEPLRRALGAVPGLQVASVAPGDYATSPLAARADLTVFDGFLPNKWPTGGVLVVSPPAGNELLPLGAPRAVQPDEPLTASGALLEGLSLSSLRFGQTRMLSPPQWAQVALAAGEQPLILRGRSGASELAVWNFNLGGSNLATRLTFPLLVARTVRDLTPQALPSALALGEALHLRPSPRAATVEIVAPNGAKVTIAAADAASPKILDQAGFYGVSERAADGSLVYNGRVAANAGSPLESDLEPRPAPTVATVPAAPPSDPTAQGRELWPWLALVALAIVFAEWAYVHR